MYTLSTIRKKFRWTTTNALLCFLFLGIIIGPKLSSSYAHTQTSSVVSTGIVESEHPYANNENTFWVLNNNSGLNAARIYFSRIELEEFVDKIEIRDQNDILIQEITSNAPLGVWSEIVPGSLIKVILKSDSSGRFWGFAVEQIEYLNYTTLGYSPHPYPNSYDHVKTFLNPNPSPAGTRLHFDRIQLEQNVDYLIIKDSNDNPYQWITGDYLSGFTTKAVPGAVIKVQFISDSSGQNWGYNVDTVQSASPGSQDPPPSFPVALAESNHPYPPDTTQEWTIVNPNVNATSSKVHFSQLQIDHHDTLQILDANNTIIQTFGEFTDLTNVWSDYVPGRIVKLKLIAIPSGEAWGFRVDAIVDSVPNPGFAQSDHPHPATVTQEWTIVNPNINAVSSKIHFSRLHIGHHDTLHILDVNNTVIQTFGEFTDLTDVWSDYVPGRIVKLKLTAIPSGEDWGFRVDAIVDSVSNPGLAQSDHPYPPTVTQEWTIVNPNINAVSSKLHFSRLHIGHHDSLQILDINNTVVQTFGEFTDLIDVWSDYVPGRIVKVRLLAVPSGEDWGFRVDEIYPTSNEPIPRAYISGVYITVLYPGTIYLNGVEVTNVQEPGEYKILLPGSGTYTIHIVYLEYTQDIIVTVDEESALHITYLPLVTKP